jgi:quercetin 2,3-dioxygenase
VQHQSLRCTVLVGEALGQRSPARMHWPVMGLDVEMDPARDAQLPLNPSFEHAVLVSQGRVEIEGESLEPGELLYLGSQRSQVTLRTDAAARLAVVGGKAFDEPILMWWNFVGRDKAALSAACREWNGEHARFGEVHGYEGERLTAPMPPWNG